MAKENKTTTTFATRLKQARLRAGFSQMQLGVLAGIDEFSASARVNQYERGVHSPDHGTAERLAEVLDVPVSFLFESNDIIANLIMTVGQLTPSQQKQLASMIIEGIEFGQF